MTNTREEELTDIEVSKIDKIKIALEAIKNKKSKFLFFVAKTTNPAASIYEIYRHASLVKSLGYDVTILTDSIEFTKPTWIESSLTNLPHEPMEKAKLTVGTKDVIVIPEIFSNIMEQTKNLPCIRIGLLQSFDYMLNSLLPSTDWTSFGIYDVITTTKEVETLMNLYYGKNTFDINIAPPSIPDYFKYNGELKRPVMTIVGRNVNEISKVIKLFYSKFPQYSWLTFDSMVTDSKPPSPLARKNYAERLKRNCGAVWIDRISTFGTLPLEAMKAGTITVGLIPDIIPEYLLDDKGEFIENNGLWTRDIYSIPILIGDLITSFLEDSIGEDVFKTMTTISEKYDDESSNKKLAAIYNGILNKRINILKKAISDFEESKIIKSDIKSDKK